MAWRRALGLAGIKQIVGHGIPALGWDRSTVAGLALRLCILGRSAAYSIDANIIYDSKTMFRIYAMSSWWSKEQREQKVTGLQKALREA